MNAQISLSVLAIIWGSAMMQAQPSCCSPTTSTSQFASFASAADFKSAHAEPLPFVLENSHGVTDSVKLSDGSYARVYRVKASTPSSTTLLVFHEWWGLNDYIKRMCDELHQSLNGKVSVLAVDLYKGHVATDRNQAAALMKATTDSYCRDVVKNIISSVQDDKIATIGWCFGGGWSMQASLMAQSRAAACVIYYGMPETSPDKLKNLAAPVLAIFATKDDWINADVVKKFEAAMKDANKRLEVKTYNANHAFANPSNPIYDKSATADAYKTTVDFLTNNLTP